jgi:hypothetical protein
MSSNIPPSSDDFHREAAALLPWYVNGTLEAGEQAKVKTHVEQCPACRRELALLRVLAARVAAAPVPERSPRAAFGRLRETLPPREDAARALRPHRRASLRWMGRRAGFIRRFAPHLALAATVLLLAAPAGWRHLTQLAEPEFHTLADRAPVGELGDLHVVFDRSIGESRIEALLRAVGGRRVGDIGPGEVYTIRLSGKTAGKPDVDAALAYLRRQDGVIFAEPILRP